MQIIFDYETSALNAPQSFRDGIQSAGNILTGLIHDNITVNLRIGYGDYNNGADTGLSTEAEANALWGVNVSYATLRDALAGHTTSSTDQTFINSLPATATLNGQSTMYVPEAEAKALGLWTFGSGYEDGAAGFGTAIPSGSLVGVALHELTHALGRVAGDGVFDLSRYTSTGTHLFTGGSTSAPAYFSIDGGATKLADYGQTSDPGDFLNTGVQGPNDPFNEFYNASTSQSLSGVDKQLVDVLGFNVAPNLDSTLVFGDFNGDHKQDILHLSGGDALMQLSTGSAYASESYWGSGATSLDMASDVTGDGNADLIQFFNGREVVSLSSGSGFGAWHDWATGATATDRLIDLNGDGKADLVQYFQGREVVSLSSGSSFGGWHDWTSGATASDQFVDVNGDGKPDLIQYFYGRESVALSTGSSFGNWHDWTSGATATDRLVDVSGDGKADLVQFYNGREVVATSTGSGFNGWHDWASGATPNDQFVDVSGDGKADLVQYYNGREVVALSTGSSFSAWRDWATGATANDKFLDANGDGKADLVQILADGREFVALSTGTSFGPWTSWGTSASSSQLASANMALHNQFQLVSDPSLNSSPETTTVSDGSLPTSHLDAIAGAQDLHAIGQAHLTDTHLSELSPIQV